MKYTKEDIQNDPLFLDFLESRNLKPKTIKIYLVSLTHYCNLINQLPSMFIEEAEQEEDDGIKKRKRKIRQYLIQFRTELEKNNKSPATIKLYMDKIKALYREYDINIPRIKGTTQENNPSMDQLPTLKDVEKVINIASPREKATILLQLSSGMGSAEIRNLTYKDFIHSLKEYNITEDQELKDIYEIVDSENCVATWYVKRVKTGMPYVTFSTTESIKAILNYLEHRIQENIPIKKEGLLFVTSRGTRIKTKYYSTLYSRLNKRAGFGMNKNKRNFFTSHQLRKMFTSTLYRAGLDKLMIDWMLGHKINPITESYFKSKPSDLKEKYLQVMKNLTLEKVKYRKVTSEEIKKIVRDNEELRSEQEEMRKTLDELVTFAKEKPEEFVSMIRENKK